MRHRKSDESQGKLELLIIGEKKLFFLFLLQRIEIKNLEHKMRLNLRGNNIIFFFFFSFFS